MSIFIYNTKTGKKDPFVPLIDNEVSFYVCGPTVYNYVHIGNARPAIIFDTFNRLLQLHYDKVTYARNITDIDDKIIQAAQEQNIPFAVVSEKFTQAYQDDMKGLYNNPPTIQPKATEHIPDMISMIETLIDKGHAYEAEGHVLFHVPSMPNYGSLSNRNVDDMIAGARVEVASYKKDPMDFVLWKPSEANVPGWESPWGFGRPGWHIECSAMISKHFGTTIDIHGGGLDLVFPHHENELAQSTCCHGTEYVRYWMHNGMINIDGQKMSKSLGNFITVHELLAQYPGELMRFILLTSHYRSTLNWTKELIKQCEAALNRFYGALREVEHITAIEPADFKSSLVVKALCDDMNTPEAVAALHQITADIFKAESDAQKAELKGLLLASGKLLGLFNHQPDDWFKLGATDAISENEIDALIAARTQAKKDKDFAKADAVRQQLLDAGVEIQDTREGVRWSRIK